MIDIEAISASAYVRPAFVIPEGRTPSQNNVRASGRILQLSKVLSIEKAPLMRIHELKNDAERAERTAERARRRARRLDEQPSRKNQNSHVRQLESRRM